MVRRKKKKDKKFNCHVNETMKHETAKHGQDNAAGLGAWDGDDTSDKRQAFIPSRERLTVRPFVRMLFVELPSSSNCCWGTIDSLQTFVSRSWWLPASSPPPTSFSRVRNRNRMTSDRRFVAPASTASRLWGCCRCPLSGKAEIGLRSAVSCS